MPKKFFLLSRFLYISVEAPYFSRLCEAFPTAAPLCYGSPTQKGDARSVSSNPQKGASPSHAQISCIYAFSLLQISSCVLRWASRNALSYESPAECRPLHSFS